MAWLRTYLGARGDRERLRATFVAVERRAARLERVRRRSRGRRCFRESTVYTRDVGEGRGWRRRDLDVRRIEDALRAHRASREPGEHGFVKRSRKGIVTRHGDLVVKESLVVGWGGRLKDRLAPARHRAGFDHARALVAAGVATARPLAWVRRGGRDFTLYEDLSTLPRLDHLAFDRYAPGAPRAGQVRLRDAAADWLGRLHAQGIYHGDLKGCNVLVREEGRDAPAFPLIDVDRVLFFGRPVDDRRRAKNLAQLAASIPVAVTRSERLRFYRRYAAALGGSSVPEARMAAAVARALAPRTRVVDRPIE